ncbi:MAG: hypothetical protein CBD27_07810, partial [Rhodospirillaceae bacterium TMED167]
LVHCTDIYLNYNFSHYSFGTEIRDYLYKIIHLPFFFCRIPVWLQHDEHCKVYFCPAISAMIREFRMSNNQRKGCI